MASKETEDRIAELERAVEELLELVVGRPGAAQAGHGPIPPRLITAIAAAIPPDDIELTFSPRPHLLAGERVAAKVAAADASTPMKRHLTAIVGAQLAAARAVAAEIAAEASKRAASEVDLTREAWAVVGLRPEDGARFERTLGQELVLAIRDTISGRRNLLWAAGVVDQAVLTVAAAELQEGFPLSALLHFPQGGTAAERLRFVGARQILRAALREDPRGGPFGFALLGHSLGEEEAKEVAAWLGRPSNDRPAMPAAVGRLHIESRLYDERLREAWDSWKRKRGKPFEQWQDVGPQAWGALG